MCPAKMQNMQAIIFPNGTWVWGQRLMVKRARFLRRQDDEQTGERLNRRYHDATSFRDQCNRGHQSNHPLRQEAHANSRNHSEGRGDANPQLRIVEKRGREIWRRKGQPESSKKVKAGGESGNEVPETIKSIQVQAIGNGWLTRSAIGKMRRLISTQEMEELFSKEKLENVRVKAIGGRLICSTNFSKLGSEE